jgi:hypothetical protein
MKAMAVKRKIDKSVEGWKDEFFAEFPDLEAPSDDDAGEEVVAVTQKRKKSLPDGPSKRRPSAAEGVNPDRDEASCDGNGGHSDGPSGEVQFLREVQAPVDPARMRSLEAKLTQMRKKIEDLSRLNAAREQQEMMEDEDEVKAKLSELEKRTLYFDLLRDTNPNLEFPQPEAREQDEEYFSSFQRRVKYSQMPFCQPLLDQLEVLSKPPASAAVKREPFKLIDKFFKAVNVVENSILKPRFVPASLLDEVEDKKKEKVGVSGEEARLKKDTVAGQKEATALRDLRQASSALRIVNNQEVGLQTVKRLADFVQDDCTKMLDEEDVPYVFAEGVNIINVRIGHILQAIHDMRQANSHLARGVMFQYTEAVRDRRQAWLSSSNMPQGMQAEINKGPLDIYQPGSDEPLCLLSSKQVELVQQRVKSRNDNVFRQAVAHFKPHTSYPRNQNNRSNNRGRYQKKGNANVSAAAQAAGWSTSSSSQPPRGGRGRGRGGRGRGQPFSGANASNNNK